MISITIDGTEYKVKKGITILAASFETQKLAQEPFQVKIPTLYYLKNVMDIDESGVCVVEVDGKLVNASTTRVREGMAISTKTEQVMNARKEALKKILAQHHKDCIHCLRNTSCELQNLLHEYELTDEPSLKGTDLQEIDETSVVLVRDNNKCIKCKRCINVCAKMQAVSAIVCTGNGLDAEIQPASSKRLAAASCVNCGQCVAVCPVGALTEKNQIAEVKRALEDPEKYVIFQVAPAVRAALGEGYEFPIGVDVEGRIAEALRRLGADKVFDTKFGADLTIMEESHELMERMSGDGVLPMITSCCPGWIKYAEHFYPDMLENISSCKSPHQMQGAIVKSYFAEKQHIAKENIVMVSVMPGVGKKFEITRAFESGAGVPDVDISITTNELVKLLKDADIQLEAMDPDTEYDNPLGMGSGAGVIFGASGGVMEAALRTAAEKMTGTALESIDFTEVRGMHGVKDATVKIGEKELHVAVVSGLANANMLLNRIKSEEADYQFVEVMACPGGCVNGGGQPHQDGFTYAMQNVPAERAAALYENDKHAVVRKSHENPYIKVLYQEYLEEPGSERAHELLHTKYVVR